MKDRYEIDEVRIAMKKTMKRTIMIAAAIVLFAAGALAADALNLDFISKKEAKANYNIKIMEEQLSDISQLATLEYRYKADAKYDGGARQAFGWDIPLTSKSMLVYYEGIVKAGPDLADIDVDLNQAAGRLKITLSHSKILSHEIDQDTWEVLDVDNGLFNRVTPEDNSEFVKAQKRKMEQEIAESDLLAQADERAVKQMEQFVKVTYPQLQAQVVFEGE